MFDSPLKRVYAYTSCLGKNLHPGQRSRRWSSLPKATGRMNPIIPRCRVSVRTAAFWRGVDPERSTACGLLKRSRPEGLWNSPAASAAWIGRNRLAGRPSEGYDFGR